MENVKVKDNLSGEILLSVSIEQRERAFCFAAECEQMDLDVSVIVPSLPETLISSLGANDIDREELRKEIDEEIDGHKIK